MINANIMTKELLLYYFEGLDESILKLNSYIFDDGFEFVKYDWNEFEEKFFYLFTIEGQSVRSEESFINALVNSRYFNAVEVARNNYAVFLIDNYFKKSSNSYKSGDTHDRLNKLMAKLKLFKSGHIKLISSFDISEREEWHFSEFPTVYASPSKEENTYSSYSLNDRELPELKYFKDNLEIPAYLELAFNSFLEYYNIEDDKIKFIILMIALESIFNKSKDEPIRHIISRHAALTITRNRQIFDEKVNRLKFFYGLRSSIVHGKKENKDDAKDHRKYKKNLDNVTEYVLELEELVRNVLKQLIWDDKLFNSKTPKNKEDLFKLLNESSTIDDFTSN